MARIRFPMLAFILLVFAIIWLLSDLGALKVDIPWLPIALIIVAVGMVYNRFAR